MDGDELKLVVIFYPNNSIDRLVPLKEKIQLHAQVIEVIIAETVVKKPFP